MEEGPEKRTECYQINKVKGQTLKRFQSKQETLMLQTKCFESKPKAPNK